MSGARWHTLRDAEVLTLARRLPPRFDVEASAEFPPLRRGRLAHQVRQDLWRRLKRLRGFSPVVEVRRRPSGLRVRAGGQVEGRVPPGTSEAIAELLHDPALRARWRVHAQLRATSPSITGGEAMTKDHGPSIKDDETYEALRDKGYDQQKAAAIANAQANDDMNPSEKGGKAKPYEEWTKDELYDRAQELEIEGRSNMTKDELIEALRG